MRLIVRSIFPSESAEKFRCSEDPGRLKFSQRQQMTVSRNNEIGLGCDRTGQHCYKVFEWAV